MKAAGAVPKHSKATDLVPAGKLKQTIKNLGSMQRVVSLLQLAIDGQGTSTPTTQAIPGDVVVTGVVKPTLDTSNLPVTAIAEVFDSPALQKRVYGLKPTKPQLWQNDVLQSQVLNFIEYVTSPIRLDRDYNAPLAARSGQDYITDISTFLGFVHYHHGVAQLDMTTYLHPQYILSYMAYHEQKKTGYSTFINHGHIAKRVVEFLRNTHQLGGSNEQQKHAVETYTTWLDKLAMQYSMEAKGREATHDPGQEALPSVDIIQIVRVIDAYRVKSMEQCTANPSSMLLARQVHDSLFLCFNCGYIPPVRESCMCTLKVPEVDGPCTHQNCTRRQECKGNRLFFKEGRLHAYLPHHKVARHWRGKPISFALPPKLDELAQLYLKEARPLLLAPYGSTVDTFFVSKKALAFTESNMCTHWKRVMRRLLTELESTSPQLMRKLFVGRLRNATTGPRIPEVGAQHIMGNSMKQWDRTYDTNFFQRNAQVAVDAMDGWREHLLAEASTNPNETQNVAGPSSTPVVVSATTATPVSIGAPNPPASHGEEMEVEWDSETTPTQDELSLSISEDSWE